MSFCLIFLRRTSFFDQVTVTVVVVAVTVL
jgi:hypothetical protein